MRLDTTIGERLLIAGATTVSVKGITTSIIMGRTLGEVSNTLISYSRNAKWFLEINYP